MALAAAGIALAAAAQAQPSGWRLIDIGTLGGPGSYGAAVSDNGIVVGWTDAAGSGTNAVENSGTLTVGPMTACSWSMGSKVPSGSSTPAPR